MRFMSEIGLEKEVWLLDRNGRIVEPKLYGFPHDEFGFLVEIRSSPSSTLDWLINDMERETARINRKAYKLGLRVVDHYQLPIDRELIAELSQKYKYDRMPNLTLNIHPEEKRSHYNGVMGYWLTAGLHIHFSRKVQGTYEIAQLPVEQIVKEMDRKFEPVVAKAGRILGEWEPKRYGFEYRSLPSTANLSEVGYYALTLIGHIFEWVFK